MWNARRQTIALKQLAKFVGGEPCYFGEAAHGDGVNRIASRNYKKAFAMGHGDAPALALDLKSELAESPNAVAVCNSRNCWHRLHRWKFDVADIGSRAAFGVFGDIQLLAHLDIITNGGMHLLRSFGLAPALRPTTGQRWTMDTKAFIKFDHNEAVLHGPGD